VPDRQTDRQMNKETQRDRLKNYGNTLLMLLVMVTDLIVIMLLSDSNHCSCIPQYLVQCQCRIIAYQHMQNHTNAAMLGTTFHV